MEQFRTELPITPAPLIDHGTRIITTGSCFSDNIGEKLTQSKFNTLVNPLGTCYNPISIHKGLMMQKVDDDLFVESEGSWKHFDFHSKFFAGSKEELRAVLQKQLEGGHHDIIIITYGTSWVYKHKVTGKIVSNCHKRPQSEFEKILLTPDEIIRSFEELQSNTRAKIIVTLSPVRHTKDTLELNSVSKSVLRYAIHRFRNAEYFPAYEIMMDDLRDYRFYEADMIHPSDVAIGYIWEKFGERYFSKETKALNARWQKIFRSVNHRPFNEGSQQYKNFLRGVLKDLEGVSSTMEVKREIEEIKTRLHE